MTRSAFLILATMGLLAACGAEEEESVEEKFKRTEAAIVNTAETLEAETENAVATIENQLENQSDAFENSVNSAEASERNEMDVNQVR